MPLGSGAEHATSAASLDLLSEDEKLRAARFRFPADRDRWTIARASLRVILSRCSGIPAAGIRFTLGRHGKPALDGHTGLEFNLAHSGDWAIVAVTRGIPVGIDLERIRPNVNMAALLQRLGDRNPPEGQREQFQAWARREAMTKALGGALMEPAVGDLRVCDLEAPAGYAAALALVGHDPVIRFPDLPTSPSGTAETLF